MAGCCNGSKPGSEPDSGGSNPSPATIDFLGEEGCTQEASTVTVATILGNMSSIKTVVGDVWDVMTANPVLCVFICVSLLSIGFAVFRKAKRAARG